MMLLRVVVVIGQNPLHGGFQGRTRADFDQERMTIDSIS